jgi:hypothetical protein
VADARQRWKAQAECEESAEDVNATWWPNKVALENA